MPGEFGQISSYVVGMKIVTPTGDLLVVDQSDPELLQAARSSYGLFGIVVEVTLHTKPLQQLAVELLGVGVIFDDENERRPHGLRL